MPDVDDDLLETEPTPEEIETWPPRAAVAAQFGKTQRWVSQMVRTGQLHPRLDSKGFRRFDPDELDSLTPNASAVAIQNQDGIVRILSDNARVLAANNVELLKVIPAPMKDLLANQSDLIKQLFARVKELETERQQMLKDHESALSAKEERRTARLKVKREQARLDDALKTFSDLVPKFFDQLFIGRDLSAFLQTVDPAMLEGLLDPELPLLSSDQKVQLRSIVEHLKDRDQKKANGQSATAPPALTEGTPPAPKTEVVA